MTDLNRLRLVARHGLAAAALVVSAWAGAVTDLADVPLGTMTDGTAVRSNLMFILDDSLSMKSGFIPESAQRNDVRYYWIGCNRLAFDPTKTYAPPLDASGNPLPNASFTAAPIDGYAASSTTLDLSKTSNLPPVKSGATDDYIGGSWGIATRYYWVTPKTGVTVNCTSNTAPSTSNFNVVTSASSLSDAQKQNYANWFSYYRTRMLAMRAGAGRAFAKIDATRFRVGFSTISETGVSDNNKFLNIREFDAGTQKADFFTRLYRAPWGFATPLRPALEKAGRYYAKKASGQTEDPMQYSCQRNYTILSTDGYWNINDEKNYRPSYVPWNLNNSELGNVDGGSSVPRPFRDEAGTKGAGVGNTLADIAYYFYQTDLRDPALNNCEGAKGVDVCENNVPAGVMRPHLPILNDDPVDPADPTKRIPRQRMVTYTIGFGLAGNLTYDKNYETQTSGSFWSIRQGTANWGDPSPTGSYSLGNEPASRVDDLWHAAINGRGVYYSANDAQELGQSLIDALSKIDAISGSAAAAATSSLTPSAGDDWLFVPLYSTKTWDGTVNAYKINTATGAIVGDPNVPLWSASERVKTQGARSIYFRNGTALSSFEYGNLSSTQKGYFDNLCASGAEKLTQCTTLSAAAKAKVTGANIVDYLRGAKTYETTAASTDDQLFRKRDTPLGDIVNGAPVYVKKPPFKYTDEGYADFVTAKASRQAVLYVGANDGMLHAIKVSDDATGGTELWAYVPSMVMPNMYILADTAYESKHRFYVDGAPVVADVRDKDGNWRTILVGGLGKGGRGYYALDVTDPTSPQSLWEFTDDDLGFSFGNPVVAKNKAGRWIVAFSSGYDNVSPGDGKGYLYVLDAVTGEMLKKIGTGVGSTSAPSNLGKINAWVDDQTDNTAKRIYGVDMLGNVWRFDFDDNLDGDDAFLLAKTGSGQPITTKPVLSEVVSGAYKYAVVTVATGRYLGLSDISDNTVQTIYSFKDDLSTSGLGELRTNPGMVKQTLKSDRSGLDSPATVTWASQKGWYIDLSLSEGERVNVDFDQQMNQLIVASDIPKPSVCSPGGTSWLYYFDIANGKVLLTYEGGTLVAGITTILSSTGKLITLVQGIDGKNTPRQGAEPSSTPSGTLRRTSWRELVD